jgi:hypothetical protein
MTRILVSVSIAVMAGYALHALAQVRADPRSVTAIASSSSEGVSFVWFFDPADRSVYACQTGRAAQNVECKPKAALP